MATDRITVSAQQDTNVEVIRCITEGVIYNIIIKPSGQPYTVASVELPELRRLKAFFEQMQLPPEAPAEVATNSDQHPWIGKLVSLSLSDAVYAQEGILERFDQFGVTMNLSNRRVFYPHARILGITLNN